VGYIILGVNIQSVDSLIDLNVLNRCTFLNMNGSKSHIRVVENRDSMAEAENTDLPSISATPFCACFISQQPHGKKN
jgi:hypothetical protein